MAADVRKPRAAALIQHSAGGPVQHAVPQDNGTVGPTLTQFGRAR